LFEEDKEWFEEVRSVIEGLFAGEGERDGMVDDQRSYRIRRGC
jgi:hypothetical protein